MPTDVSASALNAEEQENGGGPRSQNVSLCSIVRARFLLLAACSLLLFVPNPMSKFLIFYRSGQDRLSRVSDIFDKAEACMAATAKSFAVRPVDLLNARDPDRTHWGLRQTIECVTVVNNKVIERAALPADMDVERMVRNLP